MARFSGSYRSVPFFTDMDSDEFGPRYIVHEYPQSQQAYTEYQNDIPERFTLTMFVLGKDYAAQREKLRAALAKPGPATLVHPRWGRLVVVPASKITRSETARAGGKAVFKATFVRYGGLPSPEVKADTVAIAKQRVAAVIEQTIQEASAATSPALGYEFAASERLTTLNSRLNTLLGRLAAVEQPVDEIALSIQTLTDNGTSLITQPRDFIASVAAIASSVIGSASSINFALDSYRNLSVLFPRKQALNSDTPARIQDKANHNALSQLLSQACIAHTINYVVDTSKAIDVVTNENSPFSSYNHAIAVRDELGQGIDAALLNASDQQRLRLLDLRAALFSHITAHGASLAKVYRLTPRQPIPALVLAHQLYGDATRESDIVKRNQIKHSALLSDTQELELLSE